MQPSLFYVETYKVRYSNNGVDWKMIADGANEKTFDGPKTSTEAILARTEIMLKPIIGRYFRIIPVGFALGKVLRFELYGCASSLAHSSKGTSQGKIFSTFSILQFMNQVSRARYSLLLFLKQLHNEM